jgi:conjugal transfer pilus assembly protein TraL
MSLPVVNIPRYIDSQYQVFFWEMDELIPLIVFIGVGIIFEILLFALVIGGVLTMRFSRFKLARLDGVLVHAGYWLGMFSLNKLFKNGLIREFMN